MPKLGLVPGGASATPGGEFEVAFADEGGERRLPLTEVWSVPFESCLPVRGFPFYKGQRHHAGRWWTATTGALVGYESWLERDRLILLDFDPEVVGIASQPFWLFWTAEGKSRSHAPDYFARRPDGLSLVLEVRPAERIKPRDRAAFEATRSACELLGWRYEVVGTPPGYSARHREVGGSTPPLTTNRFPTAGGCWWGCLAVANTFLTGLADRHRRQVDRG